MKSYFPPAIEPPETQLPYFEAVRRMLDNPMEGWPKPVYEELIYAPPRRDFRTIYVCDPEILKRVMLTEMDDFPHSAMQKRVLRPLLGDAVMTSAGERWRWQRHASAPSFQKARVQGVDSPMWRAAEAAIDRLSQVDPEKEIDVTHEMVRITFEIIMEAMLGGRENVDAVEMSRQSGIYLRTLGQPNVLDLAGAPPWLREVYAPKTANAVRYLRREVERVIAERRSGPRRDDLIDQLLTARDPHTGRAMSDEDLRDNLLTFWAAGHETTAITLTWALYLIANHPETEQRLVEEIAREAGDAPITTALSERLTFTKQVVLEAMRLFPPIPVMSRTSQKDTAFGAHEVRKGDIVVIPVYALHRHTKHWDDPQRFDPDRFAAEAGLDRRRYVYMPFGAGKRICMGMAFAMQEAVIVLATLIRAAKFVVRPDLPIRPLFRITMRPDGGMPMRIQMRTKASHAAVA